MCEDRDVVTNRKSRVCSLIIGNVNVGDLECPFKVIQVQETTAKFKTKFIKTIMYSYFVE